MVGAEATHGNTETTRAQCLVVGMQLLEGVEEAEQGGGVQEHLQYAEVHAESSVNVYI